MDFNSHTTRELQGGKKNSKEETVSSLYTGVIHGDLRHHNIIVKPDDSGNNEVSGILDFSLLMNG